MSDDGSRQRGTPASSRADSAPDGEPVRRCVVCRNTDRKHALLRFVVGPQGEVLFDVRHKLPGRGINVSPSRDCLNKAARGAFKRGARGTHVVLPGDPGRWIDEAIVAPLVRHYGELLSLGRRSGQLLIGAHQVERAARSEQLAAYVLATDASPGTRQKYERNAARKALPVLGLLDRQGLGQLLGRDEAVVLGWVTGTLLERFQQIERQLCELGWTGVEPRTRLADERDEDTGRDRRARDAQGTEGGESASGLEENDNNGQR